MYEREGPTRGMPPPENFEESKMKPAIFSVSTYKCRVGSARLKDSASLKREKWGGELLINIIVGTQNGGFEPPEPPSGSASEIIDTVFFTSTSLAGSHPTQ